MAGWQEVLVSNVYVVSARPRSRWGWRTWWGFRHLPFFVGSRVRFDFEAASKAEPQDNEVYWRLVNGDEEVGQGRLVPKQNPEAYVHVPVTSDMLPFSGEWKLTVGPSPHSNGPTVNVFNAVTLEGMLVKLIAPMVFGIASITIGVLSLLR